MGASQILSTVMCEDCIERDGHWYDEAFQVAEMDERMIYVILDLAKSNEETSHDRPNLPMDITSVHRYVMWELEATLHAEYDDHRFCTPLFECEFLGGK